MAQAPSHFRRQSAHAEAEDTPSPWLMRGLCLALSFAGAIVLEAGTVFGGYVGMGPSLVRMVLFFCVLCVLTLSVGAWAAGERPVLRLRWKPVVANVVCIALGIAAGAFFGLLLSLIAHDGGDVRYGISCSCMACALGLLVVNWRTVRRSMEWGFLILALAFGCTFCVLMPPSSEISWDGSTHFRNANALSFIVDAQYDGADQMMVIGGTEGALFLTGDVSFIEEHPVELDSRVVVFPHADLEDSVLRASNDALREAQDTGEVICLTGDATYPSGHYLSFRSLGLVPNACGLWMGRLLHLDCIGRYLLARLSSLVFYALTFFFAIRALRAGKAIMCAIGLAPTSLLMAANFSYDPWTIALTALAMGNYVGALQRREPLTKGRSLAICVPFVLGALVKAVLFPLGLLFFVMPARRFSSRGDRAFHYLAVTGSILFLIASFALPYLLPGADSDAGSDARGGSDVSVSRQMAYVLAHPADTLSMSVRFAARMLNPVHLGFGASAADENMLYYFPYLIATNAPLNEVLAGAEYLLLIVVSLFAGDECDESYAGIGYKLCALLGTLLAFALISGALYASFTDVGRDTISGVQYRYLLPLVAPIALVVFNTRLRRRVGTYFAPSVFFSAELSLLTLILANSFMILF